MARRMESTAVELFTANDWHRPRILTVYSPARAYRWEASASLKAVTLTFGPIPVADPEVMQVTRKQRKPDKLVLRYRHLEDKGVDLLSPGMVELFHTRMVLMAPRKTSASPSIPEVTSVT